MPINTAKQNLLNLKNQNLLRERRIIGSASSIYADVDGKKMLSFASNDYLGLASSPILAEAAAQAAFTWGVGTGSSHMITGHMQIHEKLETKLADFVGAERALLFSTGYMANLGVITALIGREDAAFSDRLNHASLIDAVILSRAGNVRYRHVDIEHLATLLKKSRAKTKLIITDAVFSMDGVLAPLPELLDLAKKYDAWLLIDDAHGFGVMGENGRGTHAHFGLGLHPRIIYVGTLGKAAGVSGAFAAGQKDVIELIMQRARSYIYTTAPSPIIAATLIKSIELIEAGSHLRSQLFSLIERLRSGLSHTELSPLPSPGPIQPIIVGENTKTLEISLKLAQKNILVPAIRPPTVPKGSARLRISLSAVHNTGHIDLLIEALKALRSTTPEGQGLLARI